MARFDLVKNGLQIERKRVTLVDILGEIGGYMEVLYVICFFIVFPFAQHGFMISAIKKLFLAKTQDPEIFKGSSNSYKKEYKKGIHNFATPKPKQLKEARNTAVYAIITLSNFQKIKLFLQSHLFGCLAKTCFKKKMK
jgi:hypothetical protein